MRPAHLCLALLLSAPAFFAQDVPDTQSPQPGQPKTPLKAPPQPTGRITGTVFCADTHRPARGALIFLGPLTQQEGATRENMTRSAMDGSFTIEHVAPGDYAVLAILPGYLSVFDQLNSDEFQGDNLKKIREKIPADSIATVRGSDATRIELTLQRGATVSGHVFYSDGAPASQVLLEVADINDKLNKFAKLEDSFNPGRLMRSMFMHESQGTDDSGHFRISGIKPGTYRVAAIEQGNPLGDGGNSDGMSALFTGLLVDPHALRMYAGDTTHKSAAKTFELRAGDEVSGIDITIPINAFHIVHGHVAAVDGRSVTRAEVLLTDTNDGTVAFQSTLSPTGEVNFPEVPAGTYKLSVKNAIIGELPPGMESVPSIALNNIPIKATHAFADADTTIIVKDTDVLDATLNLSEVPLPKDINKQFDDMRNAFPRGTIPDTPE